MSFPGGGVDDWVPLPRPLAIVCGPRSLTRSRTYFADSGFEVPAEVEPVVHEGMNLIRIGVTACVEVLIAPAIQVSQPELKRLQKITLWLGNPI
jgi:hypothetical protein